MQTQLKTFANSVGKEYKKFEAAYQIQGTTRGSKQGHPITILGHIELSYFMGKKELRLHIVDLLDDE